MDPLLRRASTAGGGSRLSTALVLGLGAAAAGAGALAYLASGATPLKPPPGARHDGWDAPGSEDGGGGLGEGDSGGEEHADHEPLGDNNEGAASLSETQPGDAASGAALTLESEYALSRLLRSAASPLADFAASLTPEQVVTLVLLSCAVLVLHAVTLALDALGFTPMEPGSMYGSKRGAMGPGVGSAVLFGATGAFVAMVWRRQGGLTSVASAVSSALRDGWDSSIVQRVTEALRGFGVSATKGGPILVRDGPSPAAEHQAHSQPQASVGTHAAVVRESVSRAVGSRRGRSSSVSSPRSRSSGRGSSGGSVDSSRGSSPVARLSPILSSALAEASATAESTPFLLHSVDGAPFAASTPASRPFGTSLGSRDVCAPLDLSATAPREEATASSRRGRYTLPPLPPTPPSMKRQRRQQLVAVVSSEAASGAGGNADDAIPPLSLDSSTAAVPNTLARGSASLSSDAEGGNLLQSRISAPILASDSSAILLRAPAPTAATSDAYAPDPLLHRSQAAIARVDAAMEGRNYGACKRLLDALVDALSTCSSSGAATAALLLSEVYDASEPLPAHVACIPPTTDRLLAAALWRRARLVGVIAPNPAYTPPADRLHFFRAGLEDALRSLALYDSDADGHKYASILFARSARDTKEKIANGYKVKEHALRASQLRPTDPVLHHILGVWCFEVASLGWATRQIASALFSAPPVSSFQEAIAHLTRSDELGSGKGSPMMTTRLTLARCFRALGNSEDAAAWARKAAAVAPGPGEDDDAAAQLQTLARALGLQLP